MDYDKLIEQLNAWNEQHLSVVCGGKHFACDYLCENEDCIVVRAITAIETLRADLARVTAERDAAVSDIETALAYGVENCELCANSQCHLRGGTKPCLPKWHGIKED